MAAISRSAELIRNIIEVKIQGSLGARLVTFDLTRHEQHLEGYICKLCECYAAEVASPLHERSCTVVDKESSDDLIVVIGWSFKPTMSYSPFSGLSESDLTKIHVTAIAQAQRNEGVDEAELANAWNEGNQIPSSPISVGEGAQKFKF